MNKLQLEIPIPSQGLNYADDSLISDYEAAEGTVNIAFKDGMPQTRKGYTKQKLYAHTGETKAISRLFFHYVSAEKRMIFVSNKTAYQMNEDKTPVRRSLGSTSSDRPNFLSVACALTGGVAYSEKVLVANGTAFKWFDETNGLTTMPVYSPTADEIAEYGTNVLSTTPDEINKQKYIILDNNRVWVAGYGAIVRISHLSVAGAMPDYFPSLQALKLPEDCTGMVSFMGEVILFTENTATLVSGATPVYSIDGSYTSTQLPGGYGCSANDSIAVGDNAVYWANKRGIYRYRYLPSGFSIPECISEFMLSDGHTRTIRKKIEQITDWTKVFAVFFDHEYRLYIGGGQVLVFDTILSTWTIYEYFNQFRHGAVYEDQLYYSGSTSDGATTPKFWIYRMDAPYDAYGTSYDGLTDDGRAISFVLKSKFFDFNRAANKKRFKRLYFTIYSELVSYDIDLIVNMDNEEYSMTSVISSKISRWGNDDPSDDESEGDYALAFGDEISTMRTNLNFPVRLRHRGKKYNIQYELRSSGINHAWLLKAVVLMMKMKELK